MTQTETDKQIPKRGEITIIGDSLLIQEWLDYFATYGSIIKAEKLSGIHVVFKEP